MKFVAARGGSVDGSDSWFEVNRPGSGPRLATSEKSSLPGDALRPSIGAASSSARSSARDSATELQRAIQASVNHGIPNDLEDDVTNHERKLALYVSSASLLAPEDAERVVASLHSDIDETIKNAQGQIDVKLADPKVQLLEKDELREVKSHLGSLRTRLSKFSTELRRFLNSSKRDGSSEAHSDVEERSILSSPWVVAPLAALGTFVVLALIGLIADANRKPKVLVVSRPQFYPLPPPPVVQPPTPHVIHIATLPPPAAPVAQPRPNIQPIVIMFPSNNKNSQN